MHFGKLVVILSLLINYSITDLISIGNRLSSG